MSNEEYLRRATEIAMQSGCIRAKRGVVIVRQGTVLGESFNMPYPANGYCAAHGCLRDKLKLEMGKDVEKTRSIHAEALAIAEASKKGILLNGATIYVTCMPCINCAKLIVASGMKEVFYIDLYGDRFGELFLKQMGVRCERIVPEGDKPETRLRDTNGQ